MAQTHVVFFIAQGALGGSDWVPRMPITKNSRLNALRQKLRSELSCSRGSKHIEGAPQKNIRKHGLCGFFRIPFEALAWTSGSSNAFLFRRISHTRECR
jgi:hypothetical protein